VGLITAAVVKLVDTADLKSAASESKHAGSTPARGTRRPMKVFDLSCENKHPFEGWFASSEEFDRQLEGGMIECPVCGSHAVRRLLSAPRLNFGAEAPEAKQPVAMTNDAAMQAMLLQMARHIQANTEDVGERFPEEARRIHYDEAPKRSIRGLASREDAAELADEGIEVMQVPFGNLLKNPVQ
jgi:hypothetical protein